MQVTVVIASYKYGHLLGNAIESVLSQTRKADRILVVDDAGGDNSCEIAKKYGLECIKREKNLGTAKNFDDIVRNHIDTERAMFLGADNWLHPTYLEKVMSSEADIVSTDIIVTGELAEKWALRLNDEEKDFNNGYIEWRFNGEDINKGNYIHGSSLFNAQKAKHYGCRGNDYNGMCVDWELWKDFINGGGKHQHIQEPLLYYRRHRFNFTNDF